MKKEELQNKIGELEGANKRLAELDERMRKEVSGFLGFYKQEYYDRSREIQVLSWAEIYFNLGKLIERTTRLEDLTLLRSQVDYLIGKDQKLNEIEKNETDN